MNLDIAKLRLFNQGLFESPALDLSTPEKVVSHMGAIQAQHYGMAKVAVNNRLLGSSFDLQNDLVGGAVVDGSIIRTHILRPTWHFVAAEDLRWMLELTAPKLKNVLGGYAKSIGVDVKIFPKTDEILYKILSGGKCLTKAEIGAEISRAGINLNLHSLTYVMFNAELNGVVCSGAPVGKNQTYALVDEWISLADSVVVNSREEALGKLAFKYFNSHSPATLEDFVWWSGLGISDARIGISMLDGAFFSKEIGGKKYYFNKELGNIDLPDDSMFLLSAWDEYLVAYRDRSDVFFDYSDAKKVISKNGIFSPVIVYNGLVIGSWKKIISGKKVSIVGEFFEKPSAKILDLFNKISSI